MKLYRDMNDVERAAADLEHQELLFLNKRSAEWTMEDWDAMSPENREWLRRRDEIEFQEAGIDPYIEMELEELWG